MQIIQIVSFLGIDEDVPDKNWHIFHPEGMYNYPDVWKKKHNQIPQK